MARPRLLVLLLLSAAAACDESFTGPTVPLNREFELAPGEALAVERASMTLRFDGVSGDVRCPLDVNVYCILGGDAIVHVTVLARGETHPYELHTGSMAPVRHEDVTIELVRLLPYPFSSGLIQPHEYRATFRVQR